MTSSTTRAPDPTRRTILVPLDGTHFVEGGVRAARALAARFGATLHTISISDIVRASTAPALVIPAAAARDAASLKEAG